MNEATRLKIANPQRVARILTRICQAGLQVIVRTGLEKGVAVKGRATSLFVDGSRAGIRISNVSDRGMQFIEGVQRVQVEFVMMSAKVVFVSVVMAKEQNSVIIAMPNALISIERRKNARFQCTEDLTAFVELSVWKPNPLELTSPPVFPHFLRLGGQLAVADLSHGGLCVVSRFPAANAVLRRGMIDDRSKLYLPMQEPLEVALEVRWIKRIKEHVREDDSKENFMRSYRFGVEFTSPSEIARTRIRQFLQQLTQAEAI